MHGIDAVTPAYCKRTPHPIAVAGQPPVHGLSACAQQRQRLWPAVEYLLATYYYTHLRKISGAIEPGARPITDSAYRSGLLKAL